MGEGGGDGEEGVERARGHDLVLQMNEKKDGKLRERRKWTLVVLASWFRKGDRFS